jgi:arylsulfatase A-like enzyme
MRENRSQFSRRDFLRLSGLLPLSLAARPLLDVLPAAPVQEAGKNVLIVIFDALSGLNLSKHGYGRHTMPNLERLGKRAIVYHNNYAGSTFTTSGTASLLTGTLPWTHRAIEDNGTLADSVLSHNIFALFEEYFGIAFTHNSWTMTILNQLRGWIDELVPRETLYLRSFDAPIHRLFYRDSDIADVAWARGIKLQDGYSYSLYLSRFYKRVRDAAIEGVEARFPRGVPINASRDAFLLEQSTDWLANRLRVTPQPFLGYFHFLPPHEPYRTSKEFYGRFEGDSLRPIPKPLAEFGTEQGQADETMKRTEYDEFILYADQAFGDFYSSLENAGVLDNTWLVVTSDHGEMFERGLIGHSHPAHFEPVVRVPLFIFEPGRETGLDVHTRTSGIDLLPTLAHVTGHAVPGWVEGKVLPPFSTEAVDPQRATFAVQARKSHQKAPLTQASMSMRKGQFKLIHYMGYPQLAPEGLTRMYDIESDPEELLDLATVRPEITAELMAELRSSLERSNEPYRT